MTSQNEHADSDSVNLGSNPSSPANKSASLAVFSAETSRTSENRQRTTDAQEPAQCIADIITRLEKATEPDRELDLAIANVGADVPFQWAHVSGCPDAVMQERYGKGAAGNPVCSLEHFTGRVDDALELIPGEWRMTDLYQGDDGRWHAGVRKPGIEVGSDDACATPAIAICIAALKARIDK